MAKTPKIKKKPVSSRSRAARRGTSPSIDTDKSLKNIEPPVESAHLQANVLGLRDGGVSKKRKQKSMSRQQRVRHQRGLERADRNLDKLGRKLATSVEKEKKVKARRANWDDLNSTISKKQHQSAGSKQPTKDAADEPKPDESSADGGDAAMLEAQQPAPKEPMQEVDENGEEAALDVIL